MAITQATDTNITALINFLWERLHEDEQVLAAGLDRAEDREPTPALVRNDLVWDDESSELLLSPERAIDEFKAMRRVLDLARVAQLEADDWTEGREVHPTRDRLADVARLDAYAEVLVALARPYLKRHPGYPAAK